MFIRVDKEEQEVPKIEGYSWINANGKEEYVLVSPHGVVTIKDSQGEVEIYEQDVKHLIKALALATGMDNVVKVPNAIIDVKYDSDLNTLVPSPAMHYDWKTREDYYEIASYKIISLD